MGKRRSLSSNPRSKKLKELVEDTQLLAGSEAYAAAARVAYSSIKTVGKSQGLDEVVSDLGRQFQRTRKTLPAANQ